MLKFVLMLLSLLFTAFFVLKKMKKQGQKVWDKCLAAAIQMSIDVGMPVVRVV